MKKNIIIFTITALLITGCATSEWSKGKADVHLNLATAYMTSGHYALALRELLEAEKFTPDDPKVHYLLGMTYYSKGLRKEAMDELNTALALKPDYSDVYSFVGTMHINDSQWDKAIESFQKALSNPLYQTPSVALYNMGRAYYGKGEYLSAINKYKEAAAKDPYSVPAYLIEQYTGMAYYALGDISNAVNHFKNSLLLAPSLYEAYYWLGQSYLKLNKRKEAISAFQTYLKASPNSNLAEKARKSLRNMNVQQ
ncbi:MAG: tetratricopeptide repeat protein [Deltaproteobacteria bacterium]|nr:tetratricopeptide repeat protein [Deltaproteobacteria bacterium]